MITTMLIKIDKPLKEKAQKTAKQLGLPLSTIINNYLKTFVIQKEVLFTESYTPNAKTIRAIKSAIKEKKEGKTAGPFDTVEEFMKSLKS